MAKNHTLALVIEPAGLRHEVEAGTSLRNAFEDAGIQYLYPCGRAQLCGRCNLDFLEGAPQPTEDEKRLLDYEQIVGGTRLACCSILDRNATVQLPVDKKMRTEHVLDTGLRHEIVIDPEVKKYRCKIRPSTIKRPLSDWVRIVKALPREVREEARPRLPVLQKLPEVVLKYEKEKTPITVTMCGKDVFDVHSTDTTDQQFGVAVDIGTTTLATLLLDLSTGREIARSGCLNPQTSFGFDLIARIHAVQVDPANTRKEHEMVIGAISDLVREMSREAGIEPASISAMAVAGNTVMTHLFLGIDPEALGRAPYSGTYRTGVRVDARDLGLPIHPLAPVYSLPSVAGFVGGDVVGDVLVTKLQTLDGINVLVDIGTNAECMVSKRGVLSCTSCPAGPAFEGGKLSCGMQAADGAVTNVGFDHDDFTFQTIGNTAPLGLCGSGVVEMIARSVEVGLIERNGRMVKPDSPAAEKLSAPLRDRLTKNGKVVDIRINKSQGDPDAIYLRQEDVREFQFSKGAVQAGVRMVLDEVDIALDEVDRLFVAGAFGSRLRVEDAVAIGLILDLPKEKVTFIGNGSLEGSRMVLLNRYARLSAEQIARDTAFVELAGRPEFQERFAMAMELAAGKGASSLDDFMSSA